MRTVPRFPVRPIGDVMRTVSGVLSAVSAAPARAAKIATSSRDRTSRMESSRRRRHERRGFFVVDEVARARGIQQRWGQLPWLGQVVRQRDRLFDEIARMAAAQRNLPRPVKVAYEPLDYVSVELQVAVLAAL